MAPSCGQVKDAASPPATGALAELHALLAAVLGFAVQAPQLIGLHAKMLEALCPLAVVAPDAAARIIAKVRAAALLHVCWLGTRQPSWGVSRKLNTSPADTSQNSQCADCGLSPQGGSFLPEELGQCPACVQAFGMRASCWMRAVSAEPSSLACRCSRCSRSATCPQARRPAAPQRCCRPAGAPSTRPASAPPT